MQVFSKWAPKINIPDILVMFIFLFTFGTSEEIGHSSPEWVYRFSPLVQLLS